MFKQCVSGGLVLLTNLAHLWHHMYNAGFLAMSTAEAGVKEWRQASFSTRLSEDGRGKGACYHKWHSEYNAAQLTGRAGFGTQQTLWREGVDDGLICLLSATFDKFRGRTQATIPTFLRARSSPVRTAGRPSHAAATFSRRTGREAASRSRTSWARSGARRSPSIAVGPWRATSPAARTAAATAEARALTEGW